jgi:outer membrane protein assembly factor BamB
MQTPEAIHFIGPIRLIRQTGPIRRARLALALVASLLATSVAVTATSSANVASDDAWRIGWPCLNGPTGNLQPVPTDVRRVDDLSEARIAWIGDERDFGTSKTGSQSYRGAEDIAARLGPEASSHPGNWANPVVADGRVFASSFRPAGPFHTATAKGKSGDVPVAFRLDAEDVVFALDATTGKTLWKTAEPGGILRGGGKRGGFQVAPCYADGRVFSLGSTGRLFAHDAATGAKLWQTDIGPTAHTEAKRREEGLAAAAQGKFTPPAGLEWFTSLVFAESVLVAPTFAGSNYGRDTGLRGYDPQDGKLLWEAKDAISKWTTPSVWRHGDREYLLCATIAGSLRLLDPRDGRELWRVDGLGPHYFPLAPSGTTVLVNARPTVDKRTPGLYAAYRISPTAATFAWTLPDEPRNQIPTWFDSCCRQRYAIRDGRVYLSTEGTKDVPGRFLILDEQTGAILAEHSNASPNEADRIAGLFYLVGDRILCRVDSHHGADRGGRHPLLLWSVAGDRIVRLPEGGGVRGLDLVEFATAYEVFQELPIVVGRVFERTDDGRLACYDLRAVENAVDYSLVLRGGNIGLPAVPLPLVFRTTASGDFLTGRSLPPDDLQTGLIYSKGRRSTQWEPLTDARTALNEARLEGTLRLGFQTHRWPIEVSLRRDDTPLTGTWKRRIPALAQTVTAEGNVSGAGPRSDRGYPTPWLKDQPWTPRGTNPEGTRTLILQVASIIPFKTPAAGLTLCLDHDGTAFVRGAAGAFSYNQAWHEVDPGGLRLDGDKLTGTLTMVLNPDAWVFPNPVAKCGAAGRLTLDVTFGPEGAAGDCVAVWGEAWDVSGAVEEITTR